MPESGRRRRLLIFRIPHHHRALLQIRNGASIARNPSLTCAPAAFKALRCLFITLASLPVPSIQSGAVNCYGRESANHALVDCRSATHATKRIRILIEPGSQLCLPSPALIYAFLASAAVFNARLIPRSWRPLRRLAHILAASAEGPFIELSRR
jgi:hypothetical protein